MSRLPPWVRTLTVAVLVGVVYIAAGKFSLRLAFVNPSATPVWLPTGIALAALLIFGYRYWPVILAGAFIVNLTTTGSPATSLGIAAGNTVEALLSAYLLNNFAGGRRCFYQAKKVFEFGAITAFAAGLSATIGVTTLLLGHLATGHDFGLVWLTWWAGDFTGFVLVAPVLLLWSEVAPELMDRHRRAEFLLLLISLVAAAYLIFAGEPPTARHFPVQYLCIPLLMWAAFRFGPRGAATINLILTAIAIGFTARGFGPFINGTPNESLLLLQGFAAIVSMVTLVVAATATELSRSARDLREAKAATEHKVEQRTSALQTMAARLQEQATLIQLAYDAIMIRDMDGVIRFWNAGAEKTYGWTKEEAFGKPKRDFLRTKGRTSLEELDRELFETGSWEGELLQIARDGRELVIHSRQTLRRDSKGQPVEIMEINRDVTAQKRAEESLRQVSGELLRSQDQERRLIGRELHDSVGQELAALKMFLNSVMHGKLPDQAAEKLNECLALADRCTQEVRTMSYLLYPPFLEELGLPAAINNCLDGFRKRSGIQTEFEISGEIGRLPTDIELMLFRVLQESLTNVHRHSGSALAEVRLVKDAGGAIQLSVRDEGKGIPPAVLQGKGNGLPRMGVGLRGMRERVFQLGGTLEVSSSEHGTTITATVPADSAESAAAEHSGVTADSNDAAGTADSGANVLKP